MKKLIIFLVLSVFALSCGNGDRPKQLLNEDQMVAIMMDIHMVEGIASSLPISYDSSKKVYPYLEHRVFEKHGVPDSVYVENLQYYLRDAAKMEQLYARVIDSLTVKQNIGEQ
ncbi:DUF4296 domain-containing protein [Litoribacter alkaliphilus]|uniref:DUF4296 domain-containing protein n=1 Tax=Litoribacter ruber TaxID=702568 RepID=A0AAP2CEI8_9BACT|nr:DUF4296 domain-containing protein [Litoribacter alkaliphilus]MBS9522873.1 DUF4296 domain-containing protein [Litoribacter alkaliphilus]